MVAAPAFPSAEVVDCSLDYSHHAYHLGSCSHLGISPTTVGSSCFATGSPSVAMGLAMFVAVKVEATMRLGIPLVMAGKLG